MGAPIDHPLPHVQYRNKNLFASGQAEHSLTSEQVKVTNEHFVGVKVLDSDWMAKGLYLVLGKLGPGKLGPGQLGPEQLSPGQLGPQLSGAQFATFQGGQLGPGQSGPRKFLLVFHFFCN